ncbi:MAG: hypothetical protein ACXAEX_08585 [Promethearchaeota archaeon]|jgi:hypothetical protein
MTLRDEGIGFNRKTLSFVLPLALVPIAVKGAQYIGKKIKEKVDKKKGKK